MQAKNFSVDALTEYINITPPYSSGVPLTENGRKSIREKSPVLLFKHIRKTLDIFPKRLIIFLYE